MRVLLVDDQKSVRESLGKLLTHANCIVTKAADGLEALDVLRNHGCEIDFILLDLSMPEMCGLTFLEKAIEEHLLTQPVGVVTGMDSEWAVGVAGISFVVPKPVTPETMETMLVNMNLAVNKSKPSRPERLVTCEFLGSCAYQKEH